MRCPNCPNMVDTVVVEEREGTRGAMIECPLCKVRAREFTWANASARYEEEYGPDEDEPVNV